MKEQQRSAVESKPAPPTEQINIEQSNPDLTITAGRAQKARAKWDKLQRKEAKKAEKAAKRASAVVSFLCPFLDAPFVSNSIDFI